MKARGGRIEYGGENVILLERVFTDNWLHFEIIGYEPEKDHLKETKQEELARLRLEVEKMLNDGLSQRDVSIILKLSKSQVCRLAHKG